ncbi:MAG: DNA mismatch repair protein MutS [Pseudohongiellaceae bacterium]|jgi:DNA mismatch repair protein MutS
MSSSEGTPWLFDAGAGESPQRSVEASTASTGEGKAPPAKSPKQAANEAANEAAIKAAPKSAGKGSGKGAGRGAKGPSPMMQQYAQAKKDAGDALLFFRMGDFYELFHDDAKVASRVLGITLTARSKGEGAIPMAGFPAKAYERHLQHLIREGFAVALCDQIEDPKLAKGLVERKVTRIVTAGTLYEDDLLDHRASNYLMVVAPCGDRAGLAWLDVSTGSFTVGDVALERVADEVSRLDPAEVVLPEDLVHDESAVAATIRAVTTAPLVPGPAWTFEPGVARQTLLEDLGVATLDGFALADDSPMIPAAGAALAYARHTQRGQSVPVNGLTIHNPATGLGLDRATRSCLELLTTQRDGRREGSLLSVMDRTRSAMGARLLRQWLVMPLVDSKAITLRQSAVAELLERPETHSDLRALLDGIPDMERIATRLLAGRGSPRDLSALRAALRIVPQLAETLSSCASAPLADAGSRLLALPELLQLLERGLAEHPAATLVDGGVIATGWNETLDELRALRTNGTAAIARFQAEEAARIGLPSLKVGFNRVFGYYIEISHVQAAQAQIPEHYQRKQTLTSAERYITPDLKDLETSILTAEERSRSIEAELFSNLRETAAASGEAVRALSKQVARVDVLVGFAVLAKERGWVRPVVDDGPAIDIFEGRHPVLDVLMDAGVFVPNDVTLDQDTSRLVLITGPNMAGKSTYIRQTALLVLLAQVGSFLPATRAHIGVVDRIFTRIGAADDLTGGASTFMVEMTETAAILNNATDRSLVILDEVGRGTSTWDGLSIAWAISEFLYRKIRARTLFATHYHELVELADEFPAVRNVNVSVKEWGDQIVFLHKIVPGGTDRSYGLHVARLAGVPKAVIERAGRILSDLEQRSPDLRPGPKTVAAGAEAPEPRQTALFPKPVAAILDELRSIDPDLVSPMEALLTLKRFSERLGESGGTPTGVGGTE